MTIFSSVEFDKKISHKRISICPLCFRTSVTDQLFKWSPSLPTTPGSPSKMLPSRRSQSADSPKKTCQLVSHIALQPRASRQLFPTTTNTRENSVQRDRRGDLNYTSGRVSPSGQGGTSSATSVINANKYKTMHCRNYSLKGKYGTQHKIFYIKFN